MTIFPTVSLPGGGVLRGVSKSGSFAIFASCATKRILRACIYVADCPFDAADSKQAAVLSEWRLKVDVDLVAPLRCGASAAVLERMPASVGQLLCLFLQPQDLGACASSCRTLAGWTNHDVVWGRVLESWARKSADLNTCVAAAVARQTEPEPESEKPHGRGRAQAAGSSVFVEAGAAAAVGAAADADARGDVPATISAAAGQPGQAAAACSHSAVSDTAADPTATAVRWCRNWQAARQVTQWMAEKRAADAEAAKAAAEERARRMAAMAGRLGSGRYGGSGGGGGGGGWPGMGPAPAQPHLPTYSPPAPPLLGPARGPFDLPMPFEHGPGLGSSLGRGLGVPPIGGAGSGLDLGGGLGSGSFGGGGIGGFGPF